MKRCICLNILLFVLLSVFSAFAEDRFPRPEFESEYQKPLTEAPEARAEVFEIIDTAVLFIALALASYLALKKRSRRLLWILMVFSIVYFGFVRKGCICPVGSVQNIVLSLFQASYVIPIVTLLLFILPLIFTLFFGRTFCAAVCPLGGVQDLVLLKGRKVPFVLAKTLELLPHLFLALGVLFAATGSAFLICRFDPFIPIFRMHARMGQWILTGVFLLLSTQIGRPYCRFVCPYGVLLRWMSRLSWKHVTITPNECIQCRLCEESCPFDAIHMPTEIEVPEKKEAGIRRMKRYLILAPVIVFLFGFLGSSLDHQLAKMHPKVRLAERLLAEDAGQVNGTTLDSRTFRSLGTSRQALIEQVTEIRSWFHWGGWLVGIYLGLVFMSKLFRLSLFKKYDDYTPDRSLCFSCGRCFEYCPQEHARLKEEKVKS